VCVCVCVCVYYLYLLSFKFPHADNCPMGLDRANEQTTKKSIILSPQMLCKTAIELGGTRCFKDCTTLLEEPVDPLLIA
jgi:hypothetical protein